MPEESSVEKQAYCVQGGRCEECPIHKMPELSSAVPLAVSRILDRPENIQRTKTVQTVASLHALKDANFTDPTRHQIAVVENAARMIISGECEAEGQKVGKL